MKTLLVAALLALVLLLPVASIAQDRPSASHASKPHTVAALINSDGHSFLDSKQNRWTVANPAALSGYENQRVKVKYLVSSELRYAEIVSVKRIPVYTPTSAQKSDSAFRR